MPLVINLDLRILNIHLASKLVRIVTEIDTINYYNFVFLEFAYKLCA